MSLSPNTRKVLMELFPFAAAASRTDEELDDLLDAWLADDMANADIVAFNDVEGDWQ